MLRKSGSAMIFPKGLGSMKEAKAFICNMFLSRIESNLSSIGASVPELGTVAL